MTLVAGVDGGGTRTRVVIIDADGGELGRAEGPGAVVTPGVTAPAVRAVTEAVCAAADAAGVSLPLDRLWAGLAGAGTAEGRSAVAAALSDAALADEVSVGTDVEAAFQSAFGGGPGVLVIAGTGSVAWARGSSGAVVRAGGWGERLGDEGSGYSIGIEALRAVVRAHDGRGPATALGNAVLKAVRLDGPEELVRWVAAAGKADVAALVPIVAAADAEGDLVARGILEAAAAALRLHVTAILERAGPWSAPPELAIWGGLLQEGGPLRERMQGHARELAIRLCERRLDPALGAARLALEDVSAAG